MIVVPKISMHLILISLMILDNSELLVISSMISLWYLRFAPLLNSIIMNRSNFSPLV